MHGRTSDPLSHRLQQRRAAGLLLSAVRAGYIDRQRHVPGAYIAAMASQRTAAVRRSAANADNVMLTLTAELTSLNKGLLLSAIVKRKTRESKISILMCGVKAQNSFA